ncbi:hypothetical protein AURDEDRAFT_123867 [Auricularia subglabra TFB-10046 SS5]|nr:hypothetical protein AURDEDRAFT_123867 [Auricularia subglabra TFB-10046 SS5]
MPAPRGPLWEFFHSGPKQNTAHVKAYCLGCVATRMPEDVPREDNWEAGIDLNREKKEKWFLDACDAVGHVRGDKEPMANHLLGTKQSDRCAHSSKKARAVARKVRDKLQKAEESEDDEVRPAKRKRTAIQARVEANFKQTELVVFKGVDLPFSEAQRAAIQRQCARATISGNLPFRWIEDPEVLRFLMMFRSRACDVCPSRTVLAGRLLTEEGARTEDKLKHDFLNKNVSLSTDGWKDGSRNAIAGVNLSLNGVSQLVKLSNTNAKGKDGETMCEFFGQIIDDAEATYSCRVVHFGTDNDGGAHAGRDALLRERPWLFANPCLSHQAQLINGDYFKESPEAEEAGEKATEIVGWLHGHNRVRDIFDTVQSETAQAATPLSYLVANQTRWTTHTLAFKRLLRLETPIRRTAILEKDKIVAAQVGAMTKRKQKAALEKSARTMIATIDDGALWARLATVVDDLEPITYLTNINQADDARPDTSFVSFGGIFLHFEKHPDPAICAGMIKRIEKRWEGMDQPLFFFALVLNPYEKLSRFGDKAGVDVFVLNAELLKLYDRFHSRPCREPLTTAQKEARAAEHAQSRRTASAAFFEYIADSGSFSIWAEHRETFQEVHGDHPKLFWEQFTGNPETRSLALFALVLLDVCCNQAGNERTFSDLHIKQTRLRNRLGLAKLEIMSKVGAQIRQEHLRDGLREPRDPRKVHDEARAAELLAVPRYADALEQDEAGDEDDIEGTQKVALIKSAAAWRKELAKWKGSLEDELDLAITSDGEDQPTSVRARRKSFFPRSLKLLFGGAASRPAAAPGRITRQQPSRELLLMELLAAEYEGEAPDDGALSGSDDDYEP